MLVQAANTIAAAHPDKPRPPVTALAKLRTDVQVVPTQTGNQLVRTSKMLLNLCPNNQCTLCTDCVGPGNVTVRLTFSLCKITMGLHI